MSKLFGAAITFVLVLAGIPSSQALPIYTTAGFSGGVLTVKELGSGLGLQRTNTCSGCAAGSVSGHLLFDKSLTPASGTGFVNVPLGSVTGASNDVIFDIIFGNKPLEFEFNDPHVLGGPSIQFKNGVFNGLFFVEDFTSNGKSFELSIQGGAWTIKGRDDDEYSELAASGYINIGNNALTNQALFVPTPQQLPQSSVPEPTTLALLGLGLFGLIMARRSAGRSSLQSAGQSANQVA
ncbi:PEP-CTERM protein-sorting domain-containing protein [Nitrosovibrio tenuis]|uniref:PEP-CTERM protein-sorting domain-containing protein n=2 Tax=Nitrosovibrio tenuis TaxID=1233 RepID=A0A1H7NNC0_9PROT|nr:PEP-CTERM protein-sorting domain-containing protein [Nitrosovibrio tenuis]